jgi:hypothetical protein
MENRPLQSKSRYVLAIILATIIFGAGFLIVHSISYVEYLRVSNLQSESSYQIFQDKLKYSFFKENPCSMEDYAGLTNDLTFQGQLINDLETKLGKNDEAVLFRKKFYTLMELEHFEFIRQMNQKCSSNITTMFFFYSNEKSSLDESERVGNLLGVIYNRHPEIKIYSFDMNLDSELMPLLLEKYGVKSSPTVIINEKIRVTNIENINDIEKFF